MGTSARQRRPRTLRVFVAILAGVAALASFEFYALWQSKQRALPVAAAVPPPASPTTADPAAGIKPAAPAIVGWVDVPAAESFVGDRLVTSGWAIARGWCAQRRHSCRRTLLPRADGTGTTRCRQEGTRLARSGDLRLRVRRRLRRSSSRPLRRRLSGDRQSRHDPIAREEEPHFACRDGDVAADARRTTGVGTQPLPFPDDDFGNRTRRRRGDRYAIPGLSVPHAEGRHLRPHPLHAHHAWRVRRLAVRSRIRSPAQVRRASGCRRQPCERDEVRRREAHAGAVHPQWRHLGRCQLRDAAMGSHRSPRGRPRQLPVVAQRQGLPRQLSQGTPGIDGFARSRAFADLQRLRGQGARVQAAQPSGRGGPRRRVRPRASRPVRGRRARRRHLHESVLPGQGGVRLQPRHVAPVS